MLRAFKKKIMMKIERVTCIRMFVYAMNFLSSQKWPKMKFRTFQAQPALIRVISSSIFHVNVVLDKFRWKK